MILLITSNHPPSPENGEGDCGLSKEGKSENEVSEK
jgi:hypothetical protein